MASEEQASCDCGCHGMPVRFLFPWSSLPSASSVFVLPCSRDSATWRREMIEEATAQPTVIRNSRGLSINGTRITLYDVMDYVKAGWSPETIREWLRLTDRQLSDVFSYIDRNREEVEREYEQTLADAEEIRRY